MWNPEVIFNPFEMPQRIYPKTGLPQQMIIGKNTLTFLAIVVGSIMVVNGVNWVAGALLGIELPFIVACFVSVGVILAILIPWVVLTEKVKRFSEIKRIERDARKTNCSRCGASLIVNQFGPYCERCKRYE